MVDTTEAGVEKVVTTHIGNIYKRRKKQDEKLRARIQKLCGVELKRIEKLPKPPTPLIRKHPGLFNQA